MKTEEDMYMYVCMNVRTGRVDLTFQTCHNTHTQPSLRHTLGYNVLLLVCRVYNVYVLPLSLFHQNN